MSFFIAKSSQRYSELQRAEIYAYTVSAMDVEATRQRDWAPHKRTGSRVTAVIARAVQDRFEAKFSMVPPSITTITRIFKKMQEDKPRSQFSAMKHVSEELEVLLGESAGVKVSLRHLAAVFGVSVWTIHDRLRNDLRLKPYRPQFVPRRSRECLDSRLAFAERMINRMREDPTYIERIMWTDEAMVTIVPPINKQNDRKWLPEMDIDVLSVPTPKHPAGLHIWLGFGIRSGIIGPFFLEGSVNKDSYPSFISDVVVPAMREKLGEAFHDIIFQQDGAPGHLARVSIETVQSSLFANMLSLRTPDEFPASSPDLTPLDYSVWTHVKKKVFSHLTSGELVNMPTRESLLILKSLVIEACNEFQADLVERTVRDFAVRCEKCFQERGGHFEHVLKKKI